MIKSLFKFIFLIILLNTVKAQRIGGVYDKVLYKYCINDSFDIFSEITYYKSDSELFASTPIITLQHNLSNKYVTNLLSETWFSQIGMFVSRHNFRRVIIENGTLKAEDITSNGCEKEQAIYTFGPHHRTGDLFYLKTAKNDPNYYWEKYVIYPFYPEEARFIMQLDKINYLHETSYKTFHYNIYTYLGVPYLYISFCPKIGVTSYKYSNGLKIELELMNGLPLEYYLKNNICITPFCEIE